MPRVLYIVITLGLAIYAVIDAIQTESTDVRHLPKLVWVGLILLFSPIAAIAWLITGRQRGPRKGLPGPRYPAPPRGPDDDPDFLRSL